MSQLQSWYLHTPAHATHPTRAQQLPVAGHLQAWCPLLSCAVRLQAVVGKELLATWLWV